MSNVAVTILATLVHMASAEQGLRMLRMELAFQPMPHLKARIEDLEHLAVLLRAAFLSEAAALGWPEGGLLTEAEAMSELE